MSQSEVNSFAVALRASRAASELDDARRCLDPSLPEHIRVLDEASIAGLEAEIEVLNDWLVEHNDG